MPVPVNFTKARAERFLDCIANGKPFAPSGSGWSVDDLLALAGACHSGAMSHGFAMMPGHRFETMSPERREAGERGFLA